MSLLVATAIKTTVVLLAALAGRALVHKQSAAVRHWLLAVAIGCALLMPALAYVAPTWQVPSLTDSDPQVESRVEFSVTGVASPGARSPRPLPEAPPPRIEIGAFLLTVWLGGTVIAIALLVAGLARLAAMAASAQPAGAGRCDTLAREIARAYGINRRVRLLHGSHPAMLMTWGLIRPTVILPEDARGWTDDRLRVVLCHELAHIHRGDWGTQLAAELLRAVYWFNPFAWIACRRLRLDSEHACDDAVLNAGVAAPAYATHLLDLARACSRRRDAWSPALPVARPSGLERRIRAMLNAHLDRHPLTRRARFITALAFVAFAVSLAGVASLAQGPFATVAGSITDSQHAALPNATLAITNSETKARNEVRSDRNGRFEFVGLPPGDYLLEAAVLGFRNYRTTLALNGQQVDRDIVLDVGTIQETITVVDSDDPPRPVSPEDLEKIQQRLQARAARQAAAGCPAVQPGVVPTGGNIRPPAKLVDVRPEYPLALRREKIGGTVAIEARIATDGSVKEARPDPSAHPDLARAAVDAVRGWRFDETLLNCVPIEVSMTVKVTFKPRP
jgi:TonB family protein